MVASSVPDAWGLWSILDKTLEAARWVRVPPFGLAMGTPSAGIPISPNDGVTIFVPASDVTNLAAAANALDSALKAEDIKVSEAIDNGPQARPKIIVVEIGTRPL